MQTIPLPIPSDLPADCLSGRVVLVTGASRGIGHAVARAVAAHGARTLLAGRDVRRLEGLADEIEATGAAAPVILPINFEGAGVEDYETIASLIRQNLGRLDAVVLNAAMLGELCSLETSDPVLWARVFQVNVHSQYLLIRALLPLLRGSSAGSVLACSSGVGRQGRALWGAYAASKFALEGMMQVLADEVGGVSHLRVNSINPGRTRTRMRAQAYPAENPATLPTPEDIAPAFVAVLAGRPDCHGAALEIVPDAPRV
jgi:NAD(P)-dependent dehydrogenase (short-subunit alcohol dehydrogenase family)